MTTPSNTKFSPPRRFRFGLRSLFVLVTVVAAGSAWVGYSLSWIRGRLEFLSTERGLSLVADTVVYDNRPAAPGLLWVFGEVGRSKIYVKGPNDEQLAKRLFPEAEIEIFPEIFRITP